MLCLLPSEISRGYYNSTRVDWILNFKACSFFAYLSSRTLFNFVRNTFFCMTLTKYWLFINTLLYVWWFYDSFLMPSFHYSVWFQIMVSFYYRYPNIIHMITIYVLKRVKIKISLFFDYRKCILYHCCVVFYWTSFATESCYFKKNLYCLRSLLSFHRLWRLRSSYRRLPSEFNYSENCISGCCL